MRTMTILFWESKFIGFPGEKFPHIAVKTADAYFSFYPSINKEKLDPAKIYPGKCVVDEKNDYSPREKPSLEITLQFLKENEKAVQATIEALRQKNPSWQKWGVVATGNAFNAFTATMLILKNTQLLNKLSDRQLNQFFSSSSDISRLITKSEILLNMSAFESFSRTINKEITPTIVLALIKGVHNPSCWTTFSNIAAVPRLYLVDIGIGGLISSLIVGTGLDEPKIASVIGCGSLGMFFLYAVLTIRNGFYNVHDSKDSKTHAPAAWSKHLLLATGTASAIASAATAVSFFSLPPISPVISDLPISNASVEEYMTRFME